MILDHRRVGVAIQRQKIAARMDPLVGWQPKSWAQERILREIHLGELFARFGNFAGKTVVGSRLSVAFMRGLRDLGGIRLPPIQIPNESVLVVPSYKQSLLSRISAMRQAIGAHDHHVVPVAGGQDYVGAFYVRPDGWRDGDWRTWSSMLVLPHNGELPEGARLNFAWADEPPPAWWGDVVRARRKAGQPFYRLITATPKRKREWEWLRADYAKAHGGKLNEWVNGRMEMVCPMRDNMALTEADKLAFEQDAAGNDFERAMLYGDYVNVDGTNPFRADVLALWRSRVRDPLRSTALIERSIDTSAGHKKTRVACVVETWAEPTAEGVYLVTVDTGKGMAGGNHDPDCLHVWERRTRRLVARVNEYLGGYGIGQAAQTMARRYNGAMVDPAVTGGYGEAVLLGLAGYGNVSQDMREVAPGKMAPSLGFTESLASNAAWRGAVEAALAMDNVLIESADVLDCFEELVVDEKGKVLAGPRGHDEDWVCAGRAIYVMGSSGAAVAARPPGEPPRTWNDLIHEMTSGRQANEWGERPIERW